MIELDLSPDEQQRLEAVAKQAGVSPDVWARNAVIEFIEDKEDLAIAEERLRLNTGETISWDAVKAKLF